METASSAQVDDVFIHGLFRGSVTSYNMHA